MKSNNAFAVVLEHLVEYCTVYTKAYLALEKAGLPTSAAQSEARILALMAITPTEALDIIHSFGEKVGEA